MKTRAFSITRIVGTFLAIMLVFTFTGCENKQVNELLDSYDNYVSKMEAAIKNTEFDNIAELLVSTADIVEKLNDLETDAKWSKKQKERLAQIGIRYAKVLSESSSATSTLNDDDDFGLTDLSALLSF